MPARALAASGGGLEPPPLDWGKGHAATSRVYYELAAHPAILDVVARSSGRT